MNQDNYEENAAGCSFVMSVMSFLHYPLSHCREYFDRRKLILENLKRVINI